MLTQLERNALAWSEHAQLIRDARYASLDANAIRCPRGVRYGAWIDSLSANMLYLLYARTARQWAKASREGDVWCDRAECIRLAKHWLKKAAAVRKDNA